MLSIRIIFLLFIILGEFTLSAYPQSTRPVTDFQQIKAMVDSNRFETRYTIATTHYSYFMEPSTPYSDQNIRIGNDSAFISVNDSIATGYLPYFRRSYSLPQTGPRGIIFSNKMTDLSSQLKGRGKRQGISYVFSVVGIYDFYKLQFVIQHNGTCYLYVSSTKRSPISYVGQVVQKTH